MTNDRGDLSSRTISAIKPMLMVLIVFAHIGINTAAYGKEVGVVYNLISQIISRSAVPLYFLFAGYFFFNKLIEEDKFSFRSYKDKLIRRIRTLLVPYILWNLLLMIYLIILHYFRMNTDLVTWVPRQLFLAPHKYIYFSLTNLRAYEPILYPFWFIRDLMLINLLVPLLYLLIRYMKFIVPCALLAVWLFIDHSSRLTDLGLRAITFYSLGAYFSYYKKDIVNHCSKASWYGIAAYCLLIIMYFLVPDTWQPIIKRITFVVGIAAIINVVSYLINKGKLSNMHSFGVFSFFLYGFHLFVLRFIQHYLTIVLPDNDFFVLLIYLVSVVLTIFVAYLIFALLNRYCKVVIRLLTGSRK